MTSIQLKIAKWGNGLGLHLPKDVARTINLSANDLVTLDFNENGMTIKPVYTSPISDFAQTFREYEHQLQSPMSPNDDTPKMHWTGEQVPDDYSREAELEWLKQDLIKNGPLKRRIKNKKG